MTTGLTGAGPRVVPREGVVVDLLTGRVYQRPDALPLHDHPCMWTMRR